MRSQLNQHYGDMGTLLFADGFDSAIIGFEPIQHKVVYSRSKCIKSMISDGNGDMSRDEAIEYLEFNTFGAYVGEKTPIFVDDLDWNI